MRIRPSGRRGRGWVAGTATVMLVVACARRAGAEADGRPAGTVTLDEAVAAAVAHDPALAAWGFEERARGARARQERRLPNPTLSTAVENVARFGGDTAAADSAQATVSLTQVVELGGKRMRRAEVARLEATLAGWDYARARLDAATRTRKAFVAALLSQERVALAARRRHLAREALAGARRQRDAGGGSPIDVARAAAALAQHDALVARRERERAAALAALAATWGDSTGRVTAVAGALEPVPAPPAVGAFVAGLAAQPDLARFADQRARGEAEVALEEARRVPDVSLRIGARRFVRAESNALVAEVTLPLPLLDRNADAVVEARERLAKTRAEERAAAVGAEAAVRAEHAELVAAWDEVRVLGAEVLPRLLAALAETQRAYAAGAVRHLDVLDAERTLAESEEARLDALARYHATAAELARLTGAPLAAAGEGTR